MNNMSASNQQEYNNKIYTSSQKARVSTNLEPQQMNHKPWIPRAYDNLFADGSRSMSGSVDRRVCGRAMAACFSQ